MCWRNVKENARSFIWLNTTWCKVMGCRLPLHMLNIKPHKQLNGQLFTLAVFPTAEQLQVTTEKQTCDGSRTHVLIPSEAHIYYTCWDISAAHAQKRLFKELTENAHYRFHKSPIRNQKTTPVYNRLISPQIRVSMCIYVKQTPKFKTSGGVGRRTLGTFFIKSIDCIIYVIHWSATCTAFGLTALLLSADK